MSETAPTPEQATLTPAQEETLRRLCERYEVEYDPSHYQVWSDTQWFLPGWCEGWVGGPRHANLEYGTPDEPRGKPTIYVGVSPDGSAHS